MDSHKVKYLAKQPNEVLPQTSHIVWKHMNEY